jgi:hypothetical protein
VIRLKRPVRAGPMKIEASHKGELCLIRIVRS